MAERQCTLCKEIFPATTEFFYKKSNTRLGVTSRGRKCHNKNWKERDAKYRANNTTSYKALQVRHKLKRTYGISPCDFTRQLISQGGQCAICCGDEPGGMGTWHVDHDHETGKVRGLLCHHCNMLLGHARDNRGTLAAASAYLDTKGVWAWN